MDWCHPIGHSDDEGYKKGYGYNALGTAWHGIAQGALGHGRIWRGRTDFDGRLISDDSLEVSPSMVQAPSQMIAIGDTEHELSDAISPYFSLADNDADPRPSLTTDSHATAVAGVAAAVANNSTGVAGVAPNCKILPVKLFENFDFPM